MSSTFGDLGSSFSDLKPYLLTPERITQVYVRASLDNGVDSVVYVSLEDTTVWFPVVAVKSFGRMFNMLPEDVRHKWIDKFPETLLYVPNLRLTHRDRARLAMWCL